jgi:hypothetical protein
MEMRSTLPRDILAQVTEVFDSRAQDVIVALSSFRAENPSLATDRILRCIIVAARSDAAEVEKYIGLASTDWRDVVTVAEYRYPNERIRDLSEPFDA